MCKKKRKEKDGTKCADVSVTKKKINAVVNPNLNLLAFTKVFVF